MAKVIITLTDEEKDGEPTIGLSIEFDPPLEQDTDPDDWTLAQEGAAVAMQALHAHFGGDEAIAEPMVVHGKDANGNPLVQTVFGGDE